MILISLDTCGYGRLHDNSTAPVVIAERAAVREIQDYVLRGVGVELIWSFVLDHEVRAIPDASIRVEIFSWRSLAVLYVPYSTAIESTASPIMSTGIKPCDALHVACAIHAGCRLFITTDRRLLRYESSSIYICDPIEALDMLHCWFS
jgi:predicted nucleic acid-binding protein